MATVLLMQSLKRTFFLFFSISLMVLYNMRSGFIRHDALYNTTSSYDFVFEFGLYSESDTWIYDRHTELYLLYQHDVFK